MHSLTDNALMLQVKSGDLDKLGLLYERHKKRLFGFFYNMNGNTSLSEDLVQNVFVRMLKYKHTFTGDGSFTAWMFKTARNVSYDHFKKDKVAKNRTEVSTMEYKLEDGHDIEKTITDKEEKTILERALQMLAPEKREILVLSKLKGMKFGEIAQILECSEGNAKVRAHRALKDLRAVFLQLDNK